MLLLALTFQALAVPDSVQLRRAARELQASFERTRRELLPVSTSGSGRCDERVGRYCYWYDPDEPPAPPEPEGIRRAREGLLAELSAMAARLPGDEWILAQRVRYTAEHGHPDSAAVLASSCGAWWCSALAGYAWYIHGDVAAAESAFAAALAAMPERVRCEWNDLDPALDPEDLRPYRKLDCRGRDSANAELFWRATPLFARGGNDVRAEWFARHTLVRAIEQAIIHHGTRGGVDYDEMMLRYGWATGFGRRPDRSPGASYEIDVVGFEPKPAYPFLSPEDGGAWPPRVERPRSRFAPRFATRIVTLDNVQIARFRRADSLVVLAGFAARRDSLFASDGVRAKLIASRAPGAAPVSASASTLGGRGALLLRTLAGGVLSLEVQDSSARAWAVYRVPLGLIPDATSELLMTVPGDSLPESLEAAARIAWPGIQVGQGGTIGLYWETYGAGIADSLVKVTLTVEPVAPGFFGRVSQSLGLKSRVPPLRLAWSRRGEGGVDFASHAVEVDLSRLKVGHYLITVQLGDGRRAQRLIEIIRLTNATG